MIHSPITLARRAAPLALLPALLLALAACTTNTEGLFSGEKVDYKGSGTKSSAGLEVPPDLTQLSRDSRYQPQDGAVSAATFQSTAAVPTAAAASSVAPTAIGDVRVERLGNERWLSTPLSPEQVWPQLQAFWKDRSVVLTINDIDAGVMETEWLENRAKPPGDFIRNTIGKVFDFAYSTGDRDKFRTRVERTASNGSEIYVSHRGVVEVYAGSQKDSTVWQPRPADPQLEAEMLSRIMARLAPVTETAAKATVAAAQLAPARARILSGRPASTLQVDDSFERAWRRVGLALDRSGFTVEDRDRAQGLYFVRYVDPALAGKEEPGLFAKWFGSAKDSDNKPARYRVSVKGEGEASTVSVLTAQGTPESGDAGQRIVTLLVDDLK